MVEISFKACGHKNIRALHPTTFEITKEPELTLKGDCIIAIKSEIACADLPCNLKKLIQTEGSKVKIALICGNVSDEVTAYGSSRLSLKSNTSMVIRKSNFTCGRTLAIKANKAAKDISRKLVEKLRNGESLLIKITAYLPK